MKRFLSVAVAAIGAFVLATGIAFSKPVEIVQEITPDDTGEVNAVGDVDGTSPLPAKVLGDTIWIADWTFDAPDGSCDDTGWVKIDNRIQNDGSNYWRIDTRFSGTGGISGRAANLSQRDLCWVIPTGYGNNWDYSIILKYQGAGSTLSFNFLCDAEPNYDFFKVEADSAGASEQRVNYLLDPTPTSPARYRQELLSYTGIQTAGMVSGLVLPDFGVPATTHEVYLRFDSDEEFSDQDGNYASQWGAGCVIDNIVVSGSLAYTENFEGALNPKA